MKTGTCHFPSYGAALRYYRPYAEFEDMSKHSPGTARNCALRDLINRKLNAGEIHIGKPALKPGQTLTIEDNRYHITDAPAPVRPLVAPRDSRKYTAADAPGYERGPMGRGKPKVARIYSVVAVAADGTAECQSWDGWGALHTEHLHISTLVPCSK